MSPRKRHPEIRGLYALMERYIDGDRRAFGRLHGRLEPRLRAFLMKLVRDEAAVDDLVQLTLLKAHLARDRFELQGGDPDGAVQGWYFAISRNVAMDYLRSKYRGDQRRVSSEADANVVEGLADAEPNAEQVGEAVERQAEIVERVREAISQLPPGQREVVELHKLRGMSMAQIAERLQVREGAVRVRAHRAYKALARLLTPKSMSGLLLVLWPLGPH
ncbi:MAG: sigma-70 family RNA polymerase sigma factor [Nannocystaceae bacterium]